MAKHLPSKKAQLHITETIAVLFIFFILVVFGIVFYARYQQTSLQEKKEELLASRAMDITLKTLFLPELMCTRGEAEAEDNCIDKPKLDFLANSEKSFFQENLGDYYFSVFGYSNISIIQTYPEPQQWTIYTKEKIKVAENGTITKDWTRKEPTFFVITLKDQLRIDTLPQYSYGYITIEVYS